MNTTAYRTTDNRDLTEMVRYQGAQIDVLREAIRELKQTKESLLQTIENLKSDIRVLEVLVNG
jgi:prefoldin subunit 5